MADQQAGTVSIKAMPDTKGFRRSLKAALEKIERGLEVTVEMAVELEQSSMSKVRAQLKELGESVKAEVSVVLDDSSMRRAQEQVRRLGEDTRATVRVDAEGVAETRREIDRLTAQVSDNVAEMRVNADTAAAREAIERVSRQIADARPEMAVDLDTTEAAARAARLTRERVMHIDADVSDAMGAVKTMVNDLSQQVVDVQVAADTKQAQTQARTLITDLKGKEVELQLRLDTNGRARDQFGRFVHDVNQADIEASLALATGEARAMLEEFRATAAADDVNVDVDANIAAAMAELVALTRDRTVKIHAELSASSLGAITGQLAALSGVRVLSDFSSSISNTVKNLDRAIPHLATTITMLGALGNVAGSTAGLLLGVAANLGQIVGVLAVAPALAMGFGTGLGVLIAALLDTGDVLGDLGPQFTALQDSISNAFWARAEAGARAMVDAFMPLANHWLPRMAEELAVIPQAFGQIMQSELGQGALTKIFAYATGSVEDFAYGIYQAFAGFLRLADAGAKYLPQMAKWFGEIGNKFNAWANDFTASGRFDEWVTRAWDNLQALGSVLGSTIGILGAFASAAEAAGSPGLQGLADGLNVVEDALKGPVWQGALTEIFEGWNDGIANMLPGLGSLADGFIALAPTIGEISRLAGEAASAVLGGLGAIAENPRFQSGLVDLFVGVRNGLQSVADVAPEIAEKLGRVMTVAGQMADTFGEVLETGIREFGPVLNDILDAATVLVPVLGGMLIGALEALGPIIRPIVEAIADWAKENPELASTLVAVAAGVGLAAVAAAKLFSALSPLVGMARAVGGALGKIKMPKFLAGGGGGLGGLGKLFGRLASGASRLAGPLGIVIGLLTAMWTNSEDLRGSVADLVESFLGFAKALGGAVMNAVRGVGDALENLGLMDALKGAFDFLGDGAGILGDLAGVLIEWIADSFKVLTAFIEGDSEGVKTALNEMFSDAVEGLRGVLVDGFTWLWDLVKMTIGTKLQEIGLVLFTWAQGLVEPIITGLMSIYTSVTGFFTNLGTLFTTGLMLVKLVWDLFWTGLVTTVTEWWVTITTALSTVWTAIQTAFTLGVTLVKLIWDTFWNGLILTVTTVWAAIVAFLTTIWTQIQAVFMMGVTLVQTIWTTFWTGLQLTVSTVWAAIVAFLTTAWVQIQAVFLMGITLVQTIWTTMWTTLQTIVTTVWTTITAAVQTGISLVQSVISAGVALISSLWSVAWATITTAASTAWATIQSVVSGAVSGLVSVLSGAASTMLSLMSSAWSGIQSAASAAWSGIQSLISSAISTVVSVLSSAAANMTSLMSSAWATIQSAASSAWSTIQSVVTTAMAGLVSAIVSGAASALSAFQNLATNALSALRTMVTNAASIGRDVVAGIISGVQGAAGGLFSTLRDLASSALDAAKGALGIKSPSRAFRDQVGKWIPAGVATGIESAAHLAVKAAKRMADNAVKASVPTKKAMTAAGKSVSGIWKEFVYSPSTTVAQGKSDWASKVMPKMAAAMKGQWGRIGRTSGAELARGLQGSVKQVAATAQKMRQAITKQLQMNRPKNAKGMAPVGTYYKKHYQKQVDSATSALKRLAAQEAALKKKLAGLGSNAGKGMANGLREQITAVQAQAKRLSATLVATVRTQLGIHSPSRVMAELGRHTGEGFRIGVGDEAAAVQSALASMVAPPSPVVPQAQAGVADGEGGASTESMMLEFLARIADATEAGKTLDEHQLIRGLQSAKRSMRMTQPI